MRIDRRRLIATAAFGTDGLLLPGGRLVAQMLSAARGEPDFRLDPPPDALRRRSSSRGIKVSSPGYESALVADSHIAAAGVTAASLELKWCDTSRRGYMRPSLTPAAATNEWVFMETIKTRSTATQASHRIRVRPGRARLETA